MVRAILDGRKTQTRRAVKPQPEPNFLGDPIRRVDLLATGNWGAFDDCGLTGQGEWRCPYGQPGHQLWVQESYHIIGHGSVGPMMTVKYLADDTVRTVQVSAETYEKFRARRTTRALGGRFMYRDISRITLEIVGVRVERLNDISEADAVAEGLERCCDDNYSGWKLPNGEMILSAIDAYSVLWGSLNGPGSWAENPWVWRIEFRRIKP